MLCILGGYKVLVEDLQLDTVVDIVRHTQNHRILRDCLQLLTCAVTVSPVGICSSLLKFFNIEIFKVHIRKYKIDNFFRQ